MLLHPVLKNIVFVCLCIPLAYSHRTCYRTCINDLMDDCCANFTDENNTRIEILAPIDNEEQNNYNLRIIQSPNFLENRLYSGSTICRYFTSKLRCKRIKTQIDKGWALNAWSKSRMVVLVSSFMLTGYKGWLVDGSCWSFMLI